MEMESLRNIQIKNHVAAMIVFSFAYLGATISTLLFNNSLSEVMTQLAIVTAAVIVYITIVFLVAQYVVKRLDIVDIAWGGGFVTAAITSFMIGGHEIGVNIQTLITTLVLIWAARLAYYILRRVSSHPEDRRYVELRKGWKGNVAVNAYLRIFLTQGILATIISIAVIHGNFSDTKDIGSVAIIGGIIWLVGFLFESIADAQLKKFLADKDNKGKLMTKGLWSYTRHPNYFGEAAQWLGIFVIVLGTPFGWVGIITPVVIGYLLIYVSGVPMTEASFATKTGWDAYKRTTSKFIPLPPKK